MRYKDRTLVFVDTAGLRRQSARHENVEFYSTIRTERAIERADVCVLLIDATEPIAQPGPEDGAEGLGRGVGLILVANKWDLVEKETMTAPHFEKEVRSRAPYLEWVPIVFTSALSGAAGAPTLDMIVEVQEQRLRRIPTHEVNEVLRALTIRTKAPHHHGSPVKLPLRHAGIGGAADLRLWVNHPEGVPESYLRYLHRGFRQAWGFHGVPLRITLRRREEER
jgi:GTPase